jgi:hypothetical protein
MSLNLHQIVSGAINAVNSFEFCTFNISTGYTVLEDGTQVLTFAPPVMAPVQVQAMSEGDLRQLDALNLQGDMRKIYMNGSFSGLLRPEAKGSDNLIRPDGSIWTITYVTENWVNWSSAVIVRQNPPLITGGP